MSKSLKKLIDINRLREFKNKLVGTGSAYVQTGAVDQTVGGTKTFLKPIVGSVTGSSGSCTGNAATATRADSAANADTATNANYANSAGSVAWSNVSGRPTAVSQFSNDSGYITTDGAAYPRRVGGVTMNFNWSGQGGQPTWLWGGEDGTNMYVYNPANFSVNYANSAGSANTANSATNASHATSADKATKAEQDGNGNNIVASYVAAGSEDSTTDIGAFMAARPSFIKSFVYNNVWTDAISMRHRNGSEDGSAYGTYIRSANMAGVSNLLWNHQFGGTWQGERTLIDSANLAGFTKSAITIYDLVPDGAEAHNSMWGGRDITAAFDAGTVSANIANGTFKDIFPGDYITKQVTIWGTAFTVNWVVADCDYWWHKGDLDSTGMETHHVVIVPQVPIFNIQMNDTNTTEGGYAGSSMYNNVIPPCATGIVSAFGASHILTFRDAITNSVDTSYTSSGITQWTGTPVFWGAWVSVNCNLMSEKMVYGAPICSAGAMDNTMATRQFSAFRLSERLINYNRQSWWLRDVVSSALFARVGSNGYAGAAIASESHGVRPFALLC